MWRGHSCPRKGLNPQPNVHPSQTQAGFVVSSKAARTGVSAPHGPAHFQSISLSTTFASYTKGGCRHLCHIQQTELRAFPTQSSRPDTGTLPLRTSEENRAICRRCHARTRTPAVPAIARSGRLAFPSPQDLAINQGNFSTGRQQATENLWPSLLGRIIRSCDQIG